MIDYSVFFGVIVAYIVVLFLNELLAAVKTKIAIRKIQEASDRLAKIVADATAEQQASDNEFIN